MRPKPTILGWQFTKNHWLEVPHLCEKKWQWLISPLKCTPPQSCNAILQMCQATNFSFICPPQQSSDPHQFGTASRAGFAPFTLLAYPWKNVFFSFSAAFCGKEGEHMTNVLFRPIFPRTTAFNFKRSPLFWKSHCCGIFCPLLPITQWSRSDDLTLNLLKNCSNC